MDNSKLVTRCMKCKVPVEFRVDERKVLRNGTVLMLGNCPLCGKRVSRITGREFVNAIGDGGIRPAKEPVMPK